MNNIKRNTIACYISDTILGTYFQLPIWIVYQSKFLSFSQIAFFSGVSLITEVITQLPTGAFADLIGRKYALSLGNLFMSLPMFLIALFPRPEIMPLYAIMWGLGKSFCMGTSKPILYETLANNGQSSLYPKILSKSVMFFQFSAAISIIMGGYLYQISANLPYLISGFTSLIGVFTSLIFVEEHKIKEVGMAIQKFAATARGGLFEIFKNSYVTKLTIMYALTLGIAQTSQQFFAQPYMLELGMSDMERSWVAMIIKISIALLGAKIVATTKIVNGKYYLLIIPVLMTVTLLPAGIVTLPLAYLVFVGIAFNSGNSDLFFSPEINKHLASSVRSTAVSIQRMLASTFGAVLQWSSIALIARSSVGNFYSYIGIFALLILIPLAYSLTQHKHRFELSNSLSLDPNLNQK